MKRLALIGGLALPAVLIILYALVTFFKPEASVDTHVLDREIGELRLAIVHKPIGLIPEGAPLSIAPGGDVLFLSGGNIVSLGRRGGLLRDPDPSLTYFALSNEGLIVTVRGSQLGYFSGGVTVDALPLPVPGLKLTPAGGDGFYLYGRVERDQWAVFFIQRGGRYAKLFTFHREISALAGYEGGLIFAADGGIYRAEPGGRILPMLTLPEAPRIRSLLYDAQRHATFFTTMESVYVLARNRLKKLAPVSGTLAGSGEGLYILSDKRQELLKLDGIFK